MSEKMKKRMGDVMEYIQDAIKDKNAEEMSVGSNIEYLVDTLVAYNDSTVNRDDHHVMLKYAKTTLFFDIVFNKIADGPASFDKRILKAGDEFSHGAITELDFYSDRHPDLKVAIVDSIAKRIGKLLLEIAFGMRFMVQEKGNESPTVQKIAVSTLKETRDALLHLCAILGPIETRSPDKYNQIKLGVRHHINNIIVSYIVATKIHKIAETECWGSTNTDNTKEHETMKSLGVLQYVNIHTMLYNSGGSIDAIQEAIEHFASIYATMHKFPALMQFYEHYTKQYN